MADVKGLSAFNLVGLTEDQLLEMVKYVTVISSSIALFKEFSGCIGSKIFDLVNRWGLQPKC